MEIEKLDRESLGLHAGINSNATIGKSYGLEIKSSTKLLPVYLNKSHKERGDKLKMAIAYFDR